MGVSSSTAKPAYPQDIKKLPVCPPFRGSSELQQPSMSLTLDAQAQLGDDFGQDTLMGLQELDSQLAIFEESSDLSNRTSAVSTSDITSDIPLNVGSTNPAT